MDTIAFELSKSNIDDYLTTSIIINGTDLRDILTYLELNELSTMNQVFAAGAYEGISPFIAFHLHNHFMKETVKEYIYDDAKYALLDYQFSGVPGDHTLVCDIDIRDNQIIWSKFQNCSNLLEHSFCYTDLSFCFDRKQYESAIQNIIENEIKNLYV